MLNTYKSKKLLTKVRMPGIALRSMVGRFHDVLSLYVPLQLVVCVSVCSYNIGKS